MEEKRKIIEIYVTENEDTTTFEFEKVEDSKIANETLKGLLQIFDFYKDDEDVLEVEADENISKGEE